MNKRRKRRAQRAQRRVEQTTLATVPPGLPHPDSPPHQRSRAGGLVAESVYHSRPGRLYLPDRLAKAAERENPISQFIRAQQHLRWGLPSQPKEDR